MRPMVIDSTDDEVDPAPIKSSSGRVVKPSAVLLDPSNVAKMPGQPKHANKRSGDIEQEPPKNKKQKHLPKNPASKSSGKGKERDVAIEDVPDVPDLPPATLIHDEVHPEGWLKDLDGIEDLPEAGTKKNKERTVDIHKHSRQKITFIHDVSTLRRHVQSMHEGKYNEWCAKTGFVSKLPNAVKDAKVVAKDLLTDHFCPAPAKAERVTAPYTDDTFTRHERWQSARFK
ncbi:hypothetical protein JB92DRAFT_3148770 [Gautieria morchelliformis]|nr:hypothetical protein JB92DRAFT_3148770 [Gautieria morchelliformis]